MRKILFACAGTLSVLLLLESGLWICGLTISAIQEFHNKHNKGSERYRIMCLGESTTQRQYPRFLEDSLNRKTKGMKFSVIDKGVAGTNSTAILSMLGRNIKEYDPQMIVIMMGINETENTVPWGRTTTGIWSLLERSRVYRVGMILHTDIAARLRALRHDKTGPRSGNSEAQIQQAEAGNAEALTRRGELLINQGRDSEAEQVLREAVRRYPNDSGALGQLGRLLFHTQREAECEKVFRRELTLTDTDWEAYYALGQYAVGRHDLDEAEKMFTQALRVKPIPFTYTNLAGIYKLKGQAGRAEKLLNEGLEAHGRSDGLLGAVGLECMQKRDPGGAEEMFLRAEEIRRSTINPVLYANYREIAGIILKKDIKLVCMQYPMRNIEPLRMMMDGYTGIIFVDNEKPFKELLSTVHMDEVFTDQFAGDFGHCHDRGNALIADHLADIILSEVGEQ
jgi:Flp pilus assembly protein TadD